MIGSLWHDLSDIGCSPQIIVVHEKRHLIYTAGRGGREVKGWVSRTLAGRIPREPFKVTGLASALSSFSYVTREL